MFSLFLGKPKGDGGWVNGGFFLCEPNIFELISSDQTIWERKPMERIATMVQMTAYKRNGFWKTMDTLREKKELENFWKEGNAFLLNVISSDYWKYGMTLGNSEGAFLEGNMKIK